MHIILLFPLLCPYFIIVCTKSPRSLILPLPLARGIILSFNNSSEAFPYFCMWSRIPYIIGIFICDICMLKVMKVSVFLFLVKVDSMPTNQKLEPSLELYSRSDFLQ